MGKPEMHSFHIPVMGLGYTINTPLKVGRFGISSVVSIVPDELIEKMREFYSRQENEPFVSIPVTEDDFRAKRIHAYLNLLHKLLNRQIEKLKKEPFETGMEIVKYFEMLPESSPVKIAYNSMKLETGENRIQAQNALREMIQPGSIDVNIMTKVDRINYTKEGVALPVEFAEAMAALRGYATSDLSSSVVFSAGMNPRLYSYCESFQDFFPDEKGILKKKIILKVSDFRSAMIQGKIFAKKGIWVSEYRIESGLNCGGHAFATEGLLAGPILQEFHDKRLELSNELFAMVNAALLEKNKLVYSQKPEMKLSYQGGLGTAHENEFLTEYYDLDSTGWGSPFLLVPEATDVDEEMLKQLSVAKQEDYYLSHCSPLGIPFNNFRNTTSEKQRLLRISKGRPGSPCYKKALAFNTEFTEQPICTASREYINLKTKELEKKHLPKKQFQAEYDKITEKDCLCEGLGASILLKNHIPVSHKLDAVNICPGPNLAFFSGVFTLQQMVDHIYGRISILNSLNRPNVLINEMKIYVDYLKKEMTNQAEAFSAKQNKYFSSFRENLLRGVEYYRGLAPQMKKEAKIYIDNFKADLSKLENEIRGIVVPEIVPVS